jgi:hypothetical protein
VTQAVVARDCFATLVSALGDAQVHRGLDGLHGARAGDVRRDGQRRAGGEALRCRREAPIAKHGRVDPVREAAQFGKSALDLGARFGDGRFRGRAARGEGPREP